MNYKSLSLSFSELNFSEFPVISDSLAHQPLYMSGRSFTDINYTSQIDVKFVMLAKGFIYKVLAFKFHSFPAS